VSIPYGLALLASIFYGAADFTGGVAARRGPAVAVTAFSGLGALAVLAVGFLFIRGMPVPADFGWAVATGVCGAAGATLIYHSLSLGIVSLAAPVFCTVGLALPVLVGVALGERPAPIAWVGIALVGLAIPLLSATGSHEGAPARSHVRKVLLVSVAAGSVIGFFLVFVSRIGAHAGLVPLVVARVVSVVLLVAIVVARRLPVLPPPAARGVALGAGALDSVANLAFWLAVQGGNLAVISALISLSPATAVMLARVLHGERWTWMQVAGLVVALGAGVAISLG
jgi:drug/metabolite transporter (DMT)-like permease